MECMIIRKWSKGLATAAIVCLLFAATGKSEQVGPDAEIGTCEECSAEVGRNVIKGTLEAISHKAGMLQLYTSSGTQVVSFDDKTVLIGAASFGSIEPQANVAVEYLNEGKTFVAVSVEVSAPKPLPGNKEIDADSIAKIIFDNTLPVSVIDARPESSYARGHIPGAISIYNGDFDRNIGKLPKDKKQLVVYYCDGTA
ncbi:MAG: rhodanese-like domain-containing protein [Desulforhopalus sp.]